MSCNLAFTPVESSVGGALIGLCAAVLLLGYGRLLGFSGILVRTSSPFIHARLPDLATWRVLTVIGLILGGIGSQSVTNFPVATIDYPIWAYALAGGVAGFGTSCGSGCTSGHGICGLGRLSPRSFVAVCTFCAVAAATSTSIISLIDGGCAEREP